MCNPSSKTQLFSGTLIIAICSIYLWESMFWHIFLMYVCSAGNCCWFYVMKNNITHWESNHVLSSVWNKCHMARHHARDWCLIGEWGHYQGKIWSCLKQNLNEGLKKNGIFLKKNLYFAFILNVYHKLYHTVGEVDNVFVLFKTYLLFSSRMQAISPNLHYQMYWFLIWICTLCWKTNSYLDYHIILFEMTFTFDSLSDVVTILCWYFT